MSVTRNVAIGMAFIGSAAAGAVVAGNYFTEKKRKEKESALHMKRALSLETKDANMLVVRQPSDSMPIALGEKSTAFQEAQGLRSRTSGVYYGAFTGEYRQK
eukprot:CAMPEP_0114125242 /NCGR_PEP_ID=MMETSP0043_2-20121206/9199_1 /TAXON_ID=464988 /ORGANISM="Hemiselmis andersenii, Strain CCMP644" /LENGTH=101 /DNA_ID=CAMNT_0001218161 /DNA_START=62 /DNA_END=367 /DNA_ORIENTATION=+